MATPEAGSTETRIDRSLLDVNPAAIACRILPFEHFILIDDARAFLAPPPPPFDADEWLDLGEVLATVRAAPLHCVAIMDLLICAPPEAKGYVRAFCNRVRPTI